MENVEAKHKQSQYTQDVKLFSTTTYIHSQKLTIELYNFTKIECITSMAIIKKPSLYAKQATPIVFGRCGPWSILLMSMAKELKVYTNDVSGGSANSPDVFGGKDLKNLNVNFKASVYLFEG